MAIIGMAGEEDFEKKFAAEEELVSSEVEKLKLIHRAFHIPQKRVDEMMQEFDCVVVQDFGDEYHLSEEEREAKNKFYKTFAKFNKAKHKYTKLDEYVKVCREALKCLDAVAEDNGGVYEPDEFRKLVLKGKIDVVGIKFPKYIGKDRKQLSWEYLAEFILSDADPSDIIKKRHDGPLTDEEFEESAKRLYDEGEIDEYLEPESEESRLRTSMAFDIDADEVGDDNIVIYMSKKEGKKFTKMQPEALISFKESRKNKKSVEHLSRLAYDFTNEDIDSIAEYDREHNFRTSGDMPIFKGEITDDDAYYKYLQELEEWEMHNTFDEYHGQQKSLDRIHELDLRSLLEENGFNIMKFYGYKEKQKKLDAIQKLEEKKLKETKKKLLRLQERKDKREGRKLGEDNVLEDIKKKRKKTKKMKKKLSAEEKKVRQYQRESADNVDELLLGMMERTSGDFSDYEADVMDFSWDSIMSGGDD